MITEELMQPGRWDLTLSPLTPASVRDNIVERGHIIITETRFDSRRYSDADLKSLSVYTGRVLRKVDGVVGETGVQIGGDSLAGWLGDADGRGVIFDVTKSFSATPWSDFITAILPPTLTVGTVTNNPGAVTADYFAVTAKAALDHAGPTPPVNGEWRVNPDGTFDSGSMLDLFVTSVAPWTVATFLAVHRGTPFDPNFKVSSSPGLSAGVDATQWVEKVLLAGKVDAAAGSDQIIMGSADLAAIGVANPYKDFFGNADPTQVVVDDPTTFVSQANSRAQELLTDLSTVQQLITLDLANFHVQGDFEVGDTVFVYFPPRLVDVSNQIPYEGGVVFPTALRAVGRTWPVKRGMGLYYRDKDGVYTDLSEYVDETGSTQVVVGHEGVNPVGVAQGVAKRTAVYNRQAPNIPADIIVSVDKNVILSGTGTIQGHVASVPQLLTAPVATANVASWPAGYSIMSVSGDATYPYSSGTIESWISGAGGAGWRIKQIHTGKTGSRVYTRYSTDGLVWDDWRLMTAVGRNGQNTTALTLAAINTTETAYTLTISGLPTTRFQAFVKASTSTYAYWAASGSVVKMRMGISLDGGATWSNSLWIRDSMSSEDYGSLMRSHGVAGAVTGTIQVRCQVQSTQLATFDEFEITAEVLSTY